MDAAIVSRQEVRESFERALALDPADRALAVAMTAHIWALAPETVEEIVADQPDALA